MTDLAHPLFGGAITADLPSNLVDASNLRQIPDTQEVFLTPDSDVTYIVEILEKVAADDLGEAVKFHFDSLAHDNSAKSSEIEIIIPPSHDPSRPDSHPAPWVLHGTQRIQKFNRASVDEVLILIALFRVEDKGMDIVLSVNIPYRSANPETAVTSENEGRMAVAAFERMVKSFRIVDYSLFA